MTSHVVICKVLKIYEILNNLTPKSYILKTIISQKKINQWKTLPFKKNRKYQLFLKLEFDLLSMQLFCVLLIGIFSHYKKILHKRRPLTLSRCPVSSTKTNNKSNQKPHPQLPQQPDTHQRPQLQPRTQPQPQPHIPHNFEYRKSADQKKKKKTVFIMLVVLRFSPTLPHWAELVIESPCPYVCLFAPSSAVFF